MRCKRDTIKNAQVLNIPQRLWEKNPLIQEYFKELQGEETFKQKKEDLIDKLPKLITDFLSEGYI